MDYLQLIPVSIKNLQIQENCIKELRDDIEYMKQELEKLKDYIKLNEQTQSYLPNSSENNSDISTEDFDNW